MPERRFKIPVTPSTVNKCIRFPDHIVADIEKAIQDSDCSFSAFVIEAAKVALENLKEDERETQA